LVFRFLFALQAYNSKRLQQIYVWISINFDIKKLLIVYYHKFQSVLLKLVNPFHAMSDILRCTALSATLELLLSWFSNSRDNTYPRKYRALKGEGILGKWSGGIAPPILNLETKWRWVVSFTSGRFIDIRYVFMMWYIDTGTT